MNVGGAGIAEYLKRAFLYRWNLLLFLGGAAASVLSPWPDALLPLLMAAEVAYLGMLVSRPRFRDAIDAQVHKEAQQPRVVQPRRISRGDYEFLVDRVPPAIRCSALTLPGNEIHRARRGRPGGFLQRKT